MTVSVRKKPLAELELYQRKLKNCMAECRFLEDRILIMESELRQMTLVFTKATMGDYRKLVTCLEQRQSEIEKNQICFMCREKVKK